MENGANNDVVLRNVIEGDLPLFFEHQLDPIANQMAAFTAKNPADREAFEKKWSKIRVDSQITIKTILVGGHIAGHVACFGPTGQQDVTYWLGKEFWGKGIATKALAEFPNLVTARPLFARAAKDNLASIRVLEKCGFAIAGYDKFFANARGKEIDEVIFQLIQ